MVSTRSIAAVLVAGGLALPALSAALSATTPKLEPEAASASVPLDLPPGAPRRVVSINLCADQLAMQMAAPGQLVSITMLARDDRSSTMVAEAQNYPINHGGAEEVYLLHPDLVLAGRYTDAATLAMIESLGIPVVLFDPAFSLDDVVRDLGLMGRALHREAVASAMIAAFNTRRAALTAPPGTAHLTAATYDANGYSGGAQSLAGDIIASAGFVNLAERFDLPMGGFVPLEALVMENPDLVLSGRPYPGNSRAEEVLHHPALGALTGGHAVLQDRDWVCGLPSVLDAVERLGVARARLEADKS